jgi:beta-1,4-N-acetylglucosaminyltransferase
MIFVTVGLMVGFERLIKKMDDIAGEIDDKIVMQIGYTEYLPKNAEYFRFKDDFKEIQKLYLNARLIVSHAGVGSIMDALEFNKPIIIVPRRQMYGEHIDDHQLDIAKELEKDERIKIIYNIEELNDVFINFDYVYKNKNINNSLVDNLSIYLKGLNAKD